MDKSLSGWIPVSWPYANVSCHFLICIHDVYLDTYLRQVVYIFTGKIPLSISLAKAEEHLASREEPFPWRKVLVLAQPNIICVAKHTLLTLYILQYISAAFLRPQLIHTDKILAKNTKCTHFSFQCLGYLEFELCTLGIITIWRDLEASLWSAASGHLYLSSWCIAMVDFFCLCLFDSAFWWGISARTQTNHEAIKTSPCFITLRAILFHESLDNKRK